MIPISFFFGGARRTDQTAGRKEGIIGAMTVAWDDQFKRQNIMWKVPRNIRMNDNIVVREDEIAVFYRDGKVLAYLDRPDRYALTSQNVAVLGKLIQALSGVVQQAEVYYLQKRIFDGKFGTQDAFLFQDPDFDMVQLRAFGDFRYRLKDPETFINQFVGTFGAATSAEVEDRIKDEIVKQLNVTLGKMKANGLKVVDFAASLNDIEQGVLANSKPHFATLGIEILQISGLSIPLPDAIKDALEKMASAKVLGRTNAAAYQQFALADSMKAVPEMRHDERRDDEVLRELRSRHDGRRGQQAVHQVRQDGRAWTEVLSRVRRVSDAEVPGRPRRPRKHEVLPGVRQAGRPELIPWSNPRPPLRAAPRCRSCRRRSSSRWAESRRSSSWRSSRTSCWSPDSGSTSSCGGPDSRR